MSLLFALILAASPTAAPAATTEKKPRLKCEWIHEVGTSRPRRICEKRVEKAKPAEQSKPAEQAHESSPPADGHSRHQQTGAN